MVRRFRFPFGQLTTRNALIVGTLIAFVRIIVLEYRTPVVHVVTGNYSTVGAESFDTRPILDCITGRVRGLVLPPTGLTHQFQNSIVDEFESSIEKKTYFQGMLEKGVWANNGREVYGVAHPSGWSADVDFAQEFIATLHIVIGEMKRRFGLERVRLLDVSCGDMAYMGRFLDTRDDIDFVGYDIVPELVAANRKKFADRRTWRFEERDLGTMRLEEQFDLVVCRFTLRVVSLFDAASLLREVSSSGSRYLLVTQYVFPAKNVEIDKRIDRLFQGNQRCVNLEAPPFSLTAPRCYFRARPPWASSGSLGALWRLPLHQNVDCRLPRLQPMQPKPYYSCNSYIPAEHLSSAAWSRKHILL